MEQPENLLHTLCSSHSRTVTDCANYMEIEIVPYVKIILVSGINNLYITSLFNQFFSLKNLGDHYPHPF
jgi:hypothetical protein